LQDAISPRVPILRRNAEVPDQRGDVDGGQRSHNLSQGRNRQRSGANSHSPRQKRAPRGRAWGKICVSHRGFPEPFGRSNHLVLKSSTGPFTGCGKKCFWACLSSIPPSEAREPLFSQSLKEKADLPWANPALRNEQRRQLFFVFFPAACFECVGFLLARKPKASGLKLATGLVMIIVCERWRRVNHA